MYNIDNLDILFNKLSNEADQFDLMVEIYLFEELVDSVITDLIPYINCNKIDYPGIWDDLMSKIIEALEREIPGWYEDYFPRQLMEFMTVEATVITSGHVKESETLLTQSEKRLLNDMLETLLWEDEERGIEYQMNELIG